jgi:hypothetical protein
MNRPIAKRHPLLILKETDEPLFPRLATNTALFMQSLLTGDVVCVGRPNAMVARRPMFMSSLEGKHRRAPAEGEVVLSLRQPRRASSELSVGEPLHLPSSPVFEGGHPASGWFSVRDTSALPAQRGSSVQSRPLKLSILMAAYNEEKTVTRVINEILKAAYPCEIELIVVDDGSTDETPTLLSQVNDPRVIVLRHPRNQGKGAALLSAASRATGTHVLPFDADLEYIPEDIPRVLEPISRGRCDVVYGVRLSGCNTVYPNYLYAAANRLLTRLANVLFNANLTDLHTCLKLVPLATLKSLNLREKGFGLDSELTASLLRLGIRPFEVPVSYYGRSHADGKKIRWHDGLACARILLWIRLRPAPRQERLSDCQEEGDLSRVAAVGPNSQHAEHVPSATGSDSNEAIKAVTG